MLSFDNTQIKLIFNNKSQLIGNFEQQILHGGVIAAVLDVASSIICFCNALSRITSLSKEVLRDRLSTFATIDLNINYLRVQVVVKNLLQVEKSFALVIRFLLPEPNCIITKINISQQA